MRYSKKRCGYTVGLQRGCSGTVFATRVTQNTTPSQYIPHPSVITHINPIRVFTYFSTMKFFLLLVSFFIAVTAIGQPSWQQRVDTKIEVRLDDKKHYLHAFEELTYTNNSPDTLRFIYIHLCVISSTHTSTKTTSGPIQLTHL